MNLEDAYGMIVNKKICEVLPQLFIGSIYYTIEDLIEVGITDVLNVSDIDLDFGTCRNGELIGYRWHPMDDNGQTQSDEYWQETVDWSKDVLDDGGVIYVHCQAGANRSAGHAYLILREYFGLGKYEAWETLHDARREVYQRYVPQIDLFLNEQSFGGSGV